MAGRTRIRGLQPTSWLPGGPWLAWTLWVVAVGAAAVLPRPDELVMTRVQAAPLPTLRGLEGLELAAGAGLPAVRAVRARPYEGSGMLTIGGTVRGLQLEEVAVDLAPGWTLRARAGLLRGDVLELGPDVRLHVEGEPGPCLQAGAARLQAGSVAFPGLARLGRGTASEDVRDLQTTVARLLERLR